MNERELRDRDRTYDEVSQEINDLLYQDRVREVMDDEKTGDPGFVSRLVARVGRFFTCSM